MIGIATDWAERGGFRGATPFQGVGGSHRERDPGRSAVSEPHSMVQAAQSRLTQFGR